MPLPNLPGWLIDFATVRSIFASGDDQLIASTEQMCAAGELKFCAYEKDDFRKSPEIRAPFCDDQNCCCNLSLDIISIAKALPTTVPGKRVHPSDRSPWLIVACALEHNFGIISGRDGLFVSPIHLGVAQGITCLTLAQFQAAV